MTGKLTAPPGLRQFAGLTCASASVLALQVIFTRIFSIMIWYHFTYLVIGVALLGGGAAGTFLAVRGWEPAVLRRRLGGLAVAFSLSILTALLLISLVHFDPLGGRQALPATAAGLALYFVALFAIYFLGGLVVSGVFSLWSGQAHRLYFADLLGGGLATVAVVGVVQALTGPGAIVLTALLALAAGALLEANLTGGRRALLAGLAAGQAALLVYLVLNPLLLPVPQSKELGWLADVVGTNQPEYTRWNPVARVDVLPLYESAGPAAVIGDISSTFNSDAHLAETHGGDPRYALQAEPVRFVTLDGTSMTAMHAFDGDLTRFHFLDHAIISAPYYAGAERPNVLLIGIGGGLDVLMARYYQAAQITAIDINGDVVALLQGPYADFTGRLGDDPRTTLAVAEGRSFLSRDQGQYDVIQGIGLDNFAALSAGAYVLSESYLYTVESLEQALARLTPNGVFAWTRNLNDRPREMLRLTGLAAEALRRQGVSDPARHIAIVANEQNTHATLLVARQPFPPEALARLRTWAAANHFPLLHDPEQRLATIYTDYLTSPDPRAFEAGYVFNIYPVTDDNPFFYNYFRWTDVRLSSGEFTGDINTNFPVGNLILFAMLGFSGLTAVAFILLPLFRHQRGGLQAPRALPALAYFSLLGLGYIFVEIILIQRFTLFIGYPVYAISTTIFSLLIASALGSLVGQRLCRTAGQLRLILLGVALAVGLALAVLPPVFQALLRWPDPARILISVVLIAPLGFLMGMPFPTGLRQLGEQGAGLVPWAWGLNGVFSVLGSALVILVSMLTNFSAALACGAAFYLGAALLAGRLWPAPAPATG